MAFNIDTFRNQVKGIQRATLFEVMVVFDGFSTNNFMFTCKSASIPSSTFGLIEVPYMGRKIKFNGDRNYQDWNTTVIVDNQWQTYKNIYNWHVRMNDPRNNIADSPNMHRASNGNINGHKGTAVIRTYAQDGSVNFAMKLDGFFPYDLQQLDMSWDSTDQTTDLNVTWAYDFAEVVTDEFTAGNSWSGTNREINLI